MNALLRLGLWGVVGAIVLSWVAAASPQPTAGTLSLRWEIQDHHYPHPTGGGTTRAVLRLHNDGPALPAGGWALYFNCASELKLGDLPDHFVAEHLGGTLFRIRPRDGAGTVASGATVELEIEHPEVVVKETRAPSGPYLVRDSEPDAGIAIRDYQILAPKTPAQEPRGQNGRAFRQTAADRYDDNQRIADLPDSEFAPVLPTPIHVKRTGGDLLLTALPRIVAGTGLSPEKRLTEELFARNLGGRSGKTLVTIRLDVDSTLPAKSPEAYSLTISPQAGIHLTGRSPAGVARGIASLQQLVSVTDQGIRLPCLSIDDAPRFAHRGLHVDVARNFQPKEVVFHLIDLMARHKLNVLHLHLTDDEGWRLEIAGLPELTEMAARRGHRADPLAMLPPAHGSGPDDDDPHGSGYYTADDYIAIVRYADSRRIRVMPEIEMPGHARAAVKAMEARARRLIGEGSAAATAYRLSDPEDRSHYVSAQGFTDNVMNPALPSTYHFVEHVVRAVSVLHARAGVPLKIIHLGGDELPRGAWTDSPAIQRWMAKEKLPDRQAVWDRFYARVADVARAQHLTVAGWEEIAARRPAAAAPLEPNPVFRSRAFNAYVWNDLEGAEDLGIRLANAGFPTVLAPVTAYYFDMVYNQNPEEPGATWAPPLALEDAFRFNPVDYPFQLPGDPARRTRLTLKGRSNLLGLEGTLWSETMRDPARIEYLLLPRMFGLAERAWAQEPAWAGESSRKADSYDRSWSVFMNQVAKVALPALDRDGAVAYRIAAPGLVVRNGQVFANHEYPGFVLRYSHDGQAPTMNSPRVSSPIEFVPGLQVAAFDRQGRRGWIAQPTP